MFVFVHEFQAYFWQFPSLIFTHAAFKNEFLISQNEPVTLLFIEKLKEVLTEETESVYTSMYSTH